MRGESTFTGRYTDRAIVPDGLFEPSYQGSDDRDVGFHVESPPALHVTNTKEQSVRKSSESVPTARNGDQKRRKRIGGRCPVTYFGGASPWQSADSKPHDRPEPGGRDELSAERSSTLALYRGSAVRVDDRPADLS
jgi:hypothetical protein